MEITHELVRELFDYCPETGALTHRRRASGPECWNARFAGTPAGTMRNDGYIRIISLGKTLFAHRIAFLWMTGKTPYMIDHINGVRHDNRWANLREVTDTDNARNTKKPKSNKSGLHGVHWHKAGGGWAASIGVQGKNQHLYYGNDFFEAVCARKSAEIRYGYHPNHGR